VDFEMAADGSECTCTLYIKGRSHPVRVTEYKDECFRATDPWKTMPKRMLRHKALIQSARVAFGFSGIYDEDEAERIRAAKIIETSAPLFPAREPAPRLTDEPAADEPKPRRKRAEKPADEPQGAQEAAPVVEPGKVDVRPRIEALARDSRIEIDDMLFALSEVGMVPSDCWNLDDLSDAVCDQIFADWQNVVYLTKGWEAK
jgi:hypothetical protein